MKLNGWPIHALFSAREWGTSDGPTRSKVNPKHPAIPLIEQVTLDEWATRYLDKAQLKELLSHFWTEIIFGIYSVQKLTGESAIYSVQPYPSLHNDNEQEHEGGENKVIASI